MGSEEQGRQRFGQRMRLSGAIFVATLLLVAEANPQGINFGGSSGSKEKEEEIANRNYGQQSSPQIQQHRSQQQCCCIPEQQQCLQNQPLTQGDDLVGEGLINERIVNRPGSGQQTLSCARGQRICCYDDQPQDPDYDFSVFQRHPSCSQPFTSSSSASHTSGRWVQVFPSFSLPTALFSEDYLLLLISDLRAAVRPQSMETSSVVQETTGGQFEDSLRGRPVLASSHGPVSFSTRTTTSSAPALLFPKASTTILAVELARS